MAVITTTNKTHYKNGEPTTSSYIVGYDSNGNRVIRFTFTTNGEPHNTTGASSLSWSLTGNYEPDSAEAYRPALRWYVGTNPTSHVSAGMSTTEYHGDVTAVNSGGEYTLSGSADIILLPNTTYYLWIFPNTTYFNYYYTSQLREATVTLSGSAGLIYIDNGTSFDAYQVYIDNGTGWDQYIPYIDNGIDWTIVS